MRNEWRGSNRNSLIVITIKGARNIEATIVGTKGTDADNA